MGDGNGGGGRLRLGWEITTRQGRLAGGRAPSWAEIRDTAKLAEAIGFDTLFVEDHLIQQGVDYFGRPIPGQTGFWEAWTVMAALAEATERVSIGPYVACSTFRNPALLAKTADTLDEVAGGRLILGLGAGWHEPEYTAFGFPYDHRVSRFEESLKVIVPLLREGRVDFRGEYVQAPNCELRPRGPRPGGPPIWIGGSGPRMLSLVATYADGYDTYGHLTPAAVVERYTALEAACRAVGRDPATITRSAATYVTLPGPDGDMTGLRADALTGAPDELAARLNAFRTEAGVEHLTVILSPGDRAALERFAPVIEALRALEGSGSA